MQALKVTRLCQLPRRPQGVRGSPRARDPSNLLSSINEHSSRTNRTSSLKFESRTFIWHIQQGPFLSFGGAQQCAWLDHFRPCGFMALYIGLMRLFGKHKALQEQFSSVHRSPAELGVFSGCGCGKLTSAARSLMLNSELESPSLSMAGFALSSAGLPLRFETPSRCGLTPRLQEYFSQSVGPVKKVLLNYNKNGRSVGVATIIFSQAQSAAEAAKKLDSVKVDGKPMKVSSIWFRQLNFC